MLSIIQLWLQFWEADQVRLICASDQGLYADAFLLWLVCSSPVASTCVFPHRVSLGSWKPGSLLFRGAQCSKSVVLPFGSERK